MVDTTIPSWHNMPNSIDEPLSQPREVEKVTVGCSM